jgi:hypothetical protein
MKQISLRAFPVPFGIGVAFGDDLY